MIVVFERLEGNITDLTGMDIRDVVYQIDQCGYFFQDIHVLSPNTVNTPGNHALWLNGIQHRDIGPSNLMYKRINGQIQGHLIDFDLGSLAGHDSQNLNCTGTIPFRALELLTPVEPDQAPVLHTCVHGAQVFCWVMLWLGLQYEGSTRVKYIGK